MKNSKKLLSFVLSLVILTSLWGAQIAVFATSDAEDMFVPGSYTASAETIFGEITLTVTVSETEILSISIDETTETLGIGDVAAVEMARRIEESGSLMADIVTGATITSFAVVSAVISAIEDAGGNPTAFFVPIPREPRTQGPVETVDVVIVGAGAAGLNAAFELEHYHPHLTFVLLEKTDLIGGAMAHSGGSIVATNSTLHEELGFEISIDDIIGQLERAMGGPVRNDLVTNLFSISEEITNRLIDWGAPINNDEGWHNPFFPVIRIPSISGTGVYALFANGSGPAFTRFFYDFIEEHPISLRTGSEVTELIVTDGAVTGVVVQDREREYEIHASAVLLATGGFGSNPEYVERYALAYGGGIARSGVGAMGSGITLTRQFDTEIVGWGMIPGGLRATQFDSAIGSLFIVSPEGVRVGNEADSFNMVDAVLGGEHVLYMLADANFPNQAALESAFDRGLIERFDSLEDLAAAKNIDVANLLDTVAAYNEAVDEGVSPGFGLPADRAVRLDTAPFYAQRIFNTWSGSVPGLHVDDDMRVLNGDNQVIPGLFAAGEVAMGNLYSGTFGGLGMPISYAIYTGVHAARTIAADID